VRCIQGFWRRNLKERDNLEDPNVDWVIIIKWIFRKWDWGAMDWVNLVQDMDSWRALVDAVMNLRVPYNAGKFLTR
jgi:hypothetical protein